MTSPLSSGIAYERANPFLTVRTGPSSARIGVTETAKLSQAVCRDLYCLPFEIASGAAKAFLLPAKPVGGKAAAENGALVRSVILDWRYRGMFLTEGERYEGVPDRIDLEKTALRILRQVMELTK